MGRQNTVENLKDGNVLQGRSCTDCPCILVFVLFAAGWAVIAALAITQGDPQRIILPTNYVGDLCGDKATVFTRDNPYLFVPKPSRWSYGFCVPKCPQVMDYVCNQDIEIMYGAYKTKVRNSNYSHTQQEYLDGMAAVADCPAREASSCPSEARYQQALRLQGLLRKLSEFKCFLVFYQSGSTLHRCLPFQPERGNLTLAEQAGESLDTLNKLTENLNVGQFFVRGFGEVTNAWIPIVLTCLTGSIISCAWLLLMRWVLKPIAYTCIILILALLVGIGYMCKVMADDLEAVRLPGEQETSYQVQLWRAGQYLFWIFSGLYVVLAIWLIKRIRIAMELMIEAAKAFISSPFMVAVPVLVFVCVVFIAGFSAVIMVYIQTIGSLDNEDFRAAATKTFGTTIVNATVQVLETNVTGLRNNSLQTVNVSAWNTPQVIKGLHAYNFFGFLWACNVCIGFGFFVVASAATVYYFSVTQMDLMMLESDDKRMSEQGRSKYSPLGTLPRSIVIALRYHIGSIIFGALLIAIIQFIRAVALYIEREVLDKIKDNPAVKFLVCVINLCLACCEKIIRIISKNAYIMVIISNTNFWSSAVKATGLLVTNILRIGTLTTMATAVCFLLKLFITISNTLIGYVLIQQRSLTQDVAIESGLFPLVCIFIISFVIATLFIGVYEACVDTIALCFFYDESETKGAFLPITLAKLVDMCTEIEKLRKVYEDQLSGISTGGNRVSMIPPQKKEESS